MKDGAAAAAAAEAGCCHCCCLKYCGNCKCCSYSSCLLHADAQNWLAELWKEVRKLHIARTPLGSEVLWLWQAAVLYECWVSSCAHSTGRCCMTAPLKESASTPFWLRRGARLERAALYKVSALQRADLLLYQRYSNLDASKRWVCSLSDLRMLFWPSCTSTARHKLVVMCKSDGS